MSADDARELFSEAYDSELDEDGRAAFDAALAADEDLAEEYAEFAEVIDGTHAMHTGGAAAPDLLKGIQRKIRDRSGGRFFRDRFAAKKQIGVAWITLLLAAVMFLVAGAAYFGLYYVQVEEEAHEPSAPSPDVPSQD
jgi:anti-sigma factor RsiW